MTFPLTIPLARHEFGVATFVKCKDGLRVRGTHILEHCSLIHLRISFTRQSIRITRPLL